MGKLPVRIPGPLGAPHWRRWRSVLRQRTFPAIALFWTALPRIVDASVAAVLLGTLSPLLLVRALWGRYQTGVMLVRTPLIGIYRIPFLRLTFAGNGRLSSLAVWLNVLRGDMAIVGPRPLSEEEAATVPMEDRVRFEVRPGLISLFGIRHRIGLAHERESAMDREQVYTQTLIGDLGIAARWMVASVLGGAVHSREMPPILNFFGIPVANTTMQEAVDWVIANAQGSKSKLMAFVNPDCLNIAWKQAKYRTVLREADRVLPDGIGLHLGCRMQGLALRSNLVGTDVFPNLCEAAARENLPIYLLGARPGVAQAVADNMVKRLPELKIAGTRHGYFSPEEEESVVAAINASGARILFVAFGAPLQELWLDRWRDRLAPSVSMGVGGLFDFYSGRMPRAPMWMREMGLEWLYRLIQEPGRMWKRYLIGNPMFLIRVWQQIKNPAKFPLPGDGPRG